MSPQMARATDTFNQLCSALSDAVGTITAQSICKRALSQAGLSSSTLNRQQVDVKLIEDIEYRLRIFCQDEKKISQVRTQLLRVVENVYIHPNYRKPREPAKTSTYGKLCGILSEALGTIMARSICKIALMESEITPAMLDDKGIDSVLLNNIKKSLRGHCRDEEKISLVHRKLQELIWSKVSDEAQIDDLTIDIIYEDDIVTARRQARILAQSLGFEHTDQIKISTAVSEVGRNIINYAGQGRIHLSRYKGKQNGIRIEAKDEGPGIDNLNKILAGRFRSRTGLGLGILGCKRLMDEFSIEAEAGKGTRITMVKYL